MDNKEIKRTAWDSNALGIDCFEIQCTDMEVLAAAIKMPGHYTVKVDPLTSKKSLHDLGFYYCDTLIEPFALPDTLNFFSMDGIAISKNASLDKILSICDSAFSHGRFHRDFHVQKHAADLRYNNWLETLHKNGEVFALLFQKETVGFICHQENNLVLHAIAPPFRGKGLAKYFWSDVCRQLISTGFPEITSSISVANTAVLNLYSSLGFRFRNPVDVYHRMVS